MDIGQGLSMFGQSMAGAMQQYHQEHVAYDQQAQLAEALSRLGVNEQGRIVPAMDQEGKSIQGIQPIIDRKAKDIFLQGTEKNRAKATGALEALNKMGMTVLGQTLGPLNQAHLSQAQSQAQLYKRTVDQPMGTTGSGQTIIQTPSGVHVVSTGAQGLTPEQRAAQQQRLDAGLGLKQQAAIKSQLNPIMEETGVTDPQQFLDPNVTSGIPDPKDPTKLVIQQNGTHVQLGKNGPIMPAAQYQQGKRLATQHQAAGAKAYSTLSGGQQTAPVKVNSPQEAIELIKAGKLKPGMIYVTPDGQPYRVPQGAGVSTGVSGVVGGGTEPETPAEDQTEPVEE